MRTGGFPIMRFALCGTSVVGVSALLTVFIMGILVFSSAEGSDTPTFRVTQPRGANCTVAELRPCCYANPGCAGCLEAAKQNCVCDKSPYCCSVAWDSQCVSVLTKSCGGCADQCKNKCYEESACPGCDTVSMKNCICAIDNYCCRVRWDQGCIAKGVSHCNLKIPTTTTTPPPPTTTTPPPQVDNQTHTTLGPAPDHPIHTNNGMLPLNSGYLALGIFLLLAAFIGSIAGFIFFLLWRRRRGGAYHQVGYQFEEDTEGGVQLEDMTGKGKEQQQATKQKGKKGRRKRGADGSVYFTNEYLGKFEEAPVFKLQDTDDDEEEKEDEEGLGSMVASSGDQLRGKNKGKEDSSEEEYDEDKLFGTSRQQQQQQQQQQKKQESEEEGEEEKEKEHEGGDEEEGKNGEA